MKTPVNTTRAILARLVDNGFDVIKPRYYLSKADNNGLKQVLATFDKLEKDPAPGNRYRAYTRFYWDQANGSAIKDENNDYSQSPEYNYMDGGKIRKFAPICNEFLLNPVIQQLMANNIEIAKGSNIVNFDSSLEIGLHQIRYQAKSSEASYSSPPWLHRDDEPLVFVHLFRLSNNVIGGDNLIAESGKLINSVIRLRNPLETLLLTQKILHAVTPMGSSNSANSQRDILLVTFQNKKPEIKNVRGTGARVVEVEKAEHTVQAPAVSPLTSENSKLPIYAGANQTNSSERMAFAKAGSALFFANKQIVREATQQAPSADEVNEQLPTLKME